MATCQDGVRRACPCDTKHTQVPEGLARPPRDWSMSVAFARTHFPSVLLHIQSSWQVRFHHLVCHMLQQNPHHRLCEVLPSFVMADAQVLSQFLIQPLICYCNSPCFRYNFQRNRNLHLHPQNLLPHLYPWYDHWGHQHRPRPPAPHASPRPLHCLAFLAKCP